MAKKKAEKRIIIDFFNKEKMGSVCSRIDRVWRDGSAGGEKNVNSKKKKKKKKNANLNK